MAYIKWILYFPNSCTDVHALYFYFSGNKAGAVEIAQKTLPLLKLYYGDNYKNIIDLSFLLKDDF